MTSLIGRRLGRYEIRAELGRGGMARVFSALDTQLQRTVAIKVLAAQLSLDDEFVRRFEREAQTAASLRHPAIVTIYDVGEQDGLHFIAMEYVAGRSLHSILEERTALGLGFAVRILEPVAQALDYAHSRGAVHRDIKPHNILIDRSGRVMLTDFGIAQTTDAESERLTRTGVFMGTPEYISPEQAEARRVDGRSDLYSLGVVAYEIVTGRVPFAGATPQLIVAHAQLPPPPPTSVAAYLPTELDEVLTKALAKRPERRYPSGAALVEALSAVAEHYATPLATREQLAALAGGPEASGGRQAAGGAGQAAGGGGRAAGGAGQAASGGAAAAGGGGRQAAGAASPGPAGPPRTGPTRPQSIPEPSRPIPARPQPSGAARPATAGQRPQPQRSGQRPQPYLAETSRRRSPTSSGAPVLLIGALLVALTLVLIFVVARGLASGPRFTIPSPTLAPPTPALQGTFVAVTNTPALLPSDTPTSQPSDTPTNTPAELATEPPLATAEPTTAPLPPTSPPPPPTQAPTLPPPPPTDTPAPPTDTVEPPSATPTDTVEPPSATPTPTDTATPTNTPIIETPVLSETATLVTPVTSLEQGP